MADPNAAVFAKIKKLLRLAASPVNPHEAALAAARVQELLFRYQLSLVDVEAGSTDDGIVEIDRLPIKAQWRRLLAANICRLSGCRLLAAPQVFRFIGLSHDLDVVLYLYTYLSRTIARLGREAWVRRVAALTDPVLGLHPILREAGHEVQWKDSFYLGAVETVIARMTVAKEDLVASVAAAAAAPTAGALVPVSRSLVYVQQRVDDYVIQKYQTTAGAQPEVHLRLDGFLRGSEAAQSVPLRRGIAGQTRRGALE